jgi:hypothetical protein
MHGTSVSMNYLTLSKLREILDENIIKGGGFLKRIADGEANVYRKKILSWLKQLNSLDKVVRVSPSPQDGSGGGGESKAGGGKTRKKYRKKYKTRRKLRRKKKRTKKKRRRKNKKSRKR